MCVNVFVWFVGQVSKRLNQGERSNVTQETTTAVTAPLSDTPPTQSTTTTTTTTAAVASSSEAAPTFERDTGEAVLLHVPTAAAHDTHDATPVAARAGNRSIEGTPTGTRTAGTFADTDDEASGDAAAAAAAAAALAARRASIEDEKEDVDGPLSPPSSSVFVSDGCRSVDNYQRLNSIRNCFFCFSFMVSLCQ